MLSNDVWYSNTVFLRQHWRITAYSMSKLEIRTFEQQRLWRWRLDPTKLPAMLTLLLVRILSFADCVVHSEKVVVVFTSTFLNMITTVSKAVLLIWTPNPILPSCFTHSLFVCPCPSTASTYTASLYEWTREGQRSSKRFEGQRSKGRANVKRMWGQRCHGRGMKWDH